MKNNTKNGKTEQKKAGRYKLTRGLNIKLSSFASLYRIFNLDDKEVWHAKIMDNQIVKEEKVSDQLQFNIEFLLNAKQCDYLIYVEEVFEKSGSTFIIQEQYDKTLVEDVAHSFPFQSGKIQDVLSDVLSGLLELYRLGYWTRSLTPEHIVSVDEVWKIQSLVHNSDMFPFESEYCWSPKYASPEDRAKNDELSDRLKDQQLVWNVGILGLYMILGPEFDYEQIKKDSDIPWAKVKPCVGESLYRFLVKALKVDFKDRMKIGQMYENEMFCNLTDNEALPFQSFSKFYSSGIHTSVKKQAVKLSEQNIKKIEILKNDIQRFKYFSQVQKYVQQLPYKNSLDINLIRYLCWKVGFENLHKIKNQLIVWKRESPNLKGYDPLKEIQEDLNNLTNKSKQNKLIYAKNMKGMELIKSEVSEVKTSLLKEINDEKIPYHEVVDLFCKLAGSIYTLLNRDYEKRENQSKARTICFYSLAVYLIFFYDTDQFDGFNNFYKNGVLCLSKLINEAPVKMVAKLTQKLIKAKFATNNLI